MPSRGSVSFAILAALSFFAGGAARADVVVSGSLNIVGGPDTITFTCTGTPTCSGTASVTTVDEGCSNSFTWSTDMTLTGLDLSHAGSPAGTLTLAHDDRSTVQGNGTCTYSINTTGVSLAYTASWTGTSGSMTLAGTNGTNQAFTFSGPFSASGAASSSPVFPMTVDGSVTTATADIDATFQPRAQDVGKSESVFVFAHAPSTLVTGAASAKRAGSARPAGAAKDDAVVCVLAQVTPSGQLIAASASTMQAYLTGVLTSQSQAVQVLNNVPTPNVAGATVYVGYGSSAAAMLSSGVYQAAVSVPGPVQCTASLASAPAPTSPGALTGLWWNANESGWGIHFTQRGSNIFAAWYTYDAAGKPKWYVASACTGMTGTSGTCTGTLYEVNGPTFFTPPFDPTLVHVASVGSLTVNFTDANDATMTYTVGSVTRTVPITRQPVGVGTLTPAVDYSDLWWNPSESGWGIAMAQQNANIFLAWYVYDATGKPVWYVASNCSMNGSSCSGTLYSTTGPPLGSGFDPHQVQVATAGSVIVSFIDANNAVLSYTVGSVTATKTITRQLF